VNKTRGREARLRSEYAELYPGIEPGIWMPVEKLLHHVTEIIHRDRSKSGVVTGKRLLHDDHFEYRGISARPAGLPENSTRLSDSGTEPSHRTESSGLSGRGPAKGREGHG